MRFFHDQEFLEDGETIMPISIGVVAEDGQEYYAEFREAFLSPGVSRIRHQPWLMANVVPHLIGRDIIRKGDFFSPDSINHPVIKPKWKIAMEVRAFIEQYGTDRDEHQLWTWYGAYDHVMLAQMYGPVVQLPPSIPMHTNDLKAIVEGIERESEGALTIELPPKPADDHNALADARWNFAAWRATVEQVNGAIDRAVARGVPAYQKAGGMITVPQDVFVALAERILAMGPNEGLTEEQERQVEAAWRALL